MQHIFTKAINHGKVVKTQSFVTDKGTYKINFLKYENDIYFVKYQDDKLVEVCNLSADKVK